MRSSYRAFLIQRYQQQYEIEQDEFIKSAIKTAIDRLNLGTDPSKVEVWLTRIKKLSQPTKVSTLKRSVFGISSLVITTVINQYDLPYFAITFGVASFIILIDALYRLRKGI